MPLQHASAEPTSKPARLRQILETAVAEAAVDGIQLSAGLDTSILATVAARQGRRLKAVCVSVADGPGLDEPYADLVATRLGLDLHVIRPQLSDLVENMPALIRILGTFDPMELRNSIASYLALEKAREIGVSRVFTGDGADELFAGYSYMFNMPATDLPKYIRHLNEVMYFSSRIMAPHVPIGVELPYIRDEIRQFALTLNFEDLVIDRKGTSLGKRILREAFADVLPDEITWRIKTPIEFGSGSTALQKFAGEQIGDQQFREECKTASENDGVALRDKEQLLYYRMYRRIFPPPREQQQDVKSCNQCYGPVPRLDMTFCRICGAYPI
jgi:asparagine synthase (glutamine-hydrolysing)